MIMNLTISDLILLLAIFFFLLYIFVIQKYIEYKKIKEILSLLESIYTKGHVIQTARDENYVYNLLDNKKIIYAKRKINKDIKQNAKESLQKCLLYSLYNINNRHDIYSIQLPDEVGILHKSEYKEVMRLFNNHRTKFNNNEKDII